PSNASTAPSPSPAPSATGASISLWQQVISATNASAILPICAQFSDPQSRDVCQWFAAGATQDKSLCAAFSDAKYLSFCTQELNGQSACTPSQCAHCTSQSSCAQFPTCNFDPSTSTCAQWSMLANPNLSVKPAPPAVGGVG
ncbi:MAG: hypothetical protein KGH63_03335, partial [Candidatus Micrarchaeota archaeon]|nr:hypothetical protein [Candidatus Micrarchaeota archaeon]